MSSHVAFRPDSDLLRRAAAGDGAAARVLLARHGRSLWREAAAVAGDGDLARAAVARAFAELLTGAGRPDATGVAWLRAAVCHHAAALTVATDPAAGHRRGGVTDDELVAALADRLPPSSRAAFLAALPDDGATPAAPAAASPPVFRPLTPSALDPTLRSLAALEALHRASVPDEGGVRPVIVASDRRAARARSLDRYLERPAPLRWVAPFALVAALVALWAWWHSPGRDGLAILFPDPRPVPTVAAILPTAKWPTLPPRATRVLAQQEPQPAAILPPSPTETPSPVAATGTPAPTPTAPRPVAAAPTATPAPPRPTATTAAPVAPAATSTRPAPTHTPTARPPTATPTQVAAKPPWLVLATQGLAFGVEVGPRALSFTNPGGVSLNWRVVADSTWIELGQVAGTVPPGGAQVVAITIARGDLPTGAYTGVLQVVSDGGEGLVPVTMAVSPSNTTISAFAEPVSPIGALGCAEPTTYPVGAAIAGDRPPRKATLYFALNGGTQQTRDLTATGGGRYGTTLGPFTEAGPVVYSLVITEADGTVVRSASSTLQVVGCPNQARVVPVVPPVTQPFALNGGGHAIYTFAVTQPGTLQVTFRWKGGAQRLSTLLYGPRRTDQPYEQRTGVGSLAWSFPVTAEDVAAGGTWALHLVNYEAGEANGTFELTFTPLGQPTPAITPSPGPSPTPRPTTPTAPAPTAPARSPTTRPGTPGAP